MSEDTSTRPTVPTAVALVVGGIAFLVAAGISFAIASPGGDDSAGTAQDTAAPAFTEVPLIAPDDVDVGGANNIMVIREPTGDQPSVEEVDQIDPASVDPDTNDLGESPSIDDAASLATPPRRGTVLLPTDAVAGSADEPPPTVPIPDEPGPVEPEATLDRPDVDPATLTGDAALVLDPFAGLTAEVVHAVDPCIGSLSDDCPDGLPGTIVPVDFAPFSITDISTDIDRYCTEQFSAVPRDSYGVAILSNRPGRFDVTSQPGAPGARADDASVETPDAETARWEADDTSDVATCVMLEREFQEGSTLEASNYLVSVSGESRDTDETDDASRMVFLRPTGRPEVRITPIDQHRFRVRVPAARDEQVIVAAMPQGTTPGNRCDEIDLGTWRWPSNANALPPVVVMPRFDALLRGPSESGAVFDQDWLFVGASPDDEPLALCVVWFDQFRPQPRATERQSWSVVPPPHPSVALSITEFSPTDADPLSPWRWSPEQGAELTVRRADGATACNVRVTEAELPSGGCRFGLSAAEGAVIPFRLSGVLRNRVDGSTMLGPPDEGALDLPRPPVRRTNVPCPVHPSDPGCLRAGHEPGVGPGAGRRGGRWLRHNGHGVDGPAVRTVHHRRR